MGQGRLQLHSCRVDKRSSVWELAVWAVYYSYTATSPRPGSPVTLYSAYSAYSHTAIQPYTPYIIQRHTASLRLTRIEPSHVLGRHRAHEWQPVQVERFQEAMVIWRDSAMWRRQGAQRRSRRSPTHQYSSHSWRKVLVIEYLKTTPKDVGHGTLPTPSTHARSTARSACGLSAAPP